MDKEFFLLQLGNSVFQGQVGDELHVLSGVRVSKEAARELIHGLGQRRVDLQEDAKLHVRVPGVFDAGGM